MVAVAVTHLPAIVLVAFGFGPRAGAVITVVGIAAYAADVVIAVWRTADYRARLWAFLIAAYCFISLVNISIPQGPYAQVGLVTLPIVVLVFFGIPAARVSSVASIALIVSAPLLRDLPAVSRTLEIDPGQVDDPLGLVWMRVAVQVAFLLGLMILLDRFQGFLLESLDAEWSAKAALQQEVIERTAAQNKVEQEMRERQRLEREVATIGDGERRRIGNELHDGVCQQLTAALLRCQVLERRLERGGTMSCADFTPISSLLEQTRDEAHSISLGVSPLEPDPEALAPALRALTKRVQEMATLRCDFTNVGDMRVPDPAMAQHIYRIAQEAVSNAVRHAHASRIAVELCGNTDELILRVEDDGAGLPSDLPADGMGLRTMSYRAQILGGQLTITPAHGGGTRVACRVPRSIGVLAAQHDLGGAR
jgi:signal transduction histidine kinase